MIRLVDEIERTRIFDSCAYTFLAALRKESTLCPLCAYSFEEIEKFIRTYGQSRFLTYSEKYPILIALRLSLKEICKSDICFCTNCYPVARSVKNIKTNGTNDDRLYTSKSFYYFLNKSVNLAIFFEMTKAECTRFKIPNFKRSLF